MVNTNAAATTAIYTGVTTTRVSAVSATVSAAPSREENRNASAPAHL